MFDILIEKLVKWNNKNRYFSKFVKYMHCLTEISRNIDFV